jgi:transcriptional regulator with XRE-family HTH domain
MTHDTAPAPPKRGPRWLLGRRLRAARKAAGFTQAQLAAEVGRGQQYIGHLEADDWSCDLEMTCMFAVALKVFPEALMPDEALDAFAKIAAALKAA